MKNLRLAAFLVFAVCAFCLPAQAQKKWTYKGDNGATAQDREEITLVITQRPNGYAVSGEFTGRERYFGDDRRCKLSGSYLLAGRRLRAYCVFSNGDKREVTGSKLAEKDGFQLSVNGGSAYRTGGEFVAWRDGIKPKSTGSSTESSSSSVSGTWKWECCDKKYSGTLTLAQDGNKLSGSFDGEGGGTIEGTITGSTLSFKRKGSWGQQDYTLALTPDGNALTGTFSGYRSTSVGVDFKATRQ